MNPYAPLSPDPNPDAWADEIAIVHRETYGQTHVLGAHWRPVLHEAHRLGVLEIAAESALSGYPPEHVAQVVQAQAARKGS